MSDNNNSLRFGKFYVVFRDNNRVSEVSHETKESAQKEADIWINILQKWPDGSRIRIEERLRN